MSEGSNFIFVRQRGYKGSLKLRFFLRSEVDVRLVVSDVKPT